MNEKKLTLSDQRLLGGVCGGFAEYIGLDPTIVRVIYAVITLCTAFCGIILYPILYWIIPSKYNSKPEPHPRTSATNASLTMRESTEKYSARPPQTPPSFLSVDDK